MMINKIKANESSQRKRSITYFLQLTCQTEVPKPQNSLKIQNQLLAELGIAFEFLYDIWSDRRSNAVELRSFLRGEHVLNIVMPGFQLIVRQLTERCKCVSIGSCAASREQLNDLLEFK